MSINENILITGSTGLIGQSLVRLFSSCGFYVFACARNIEKAKSLFGGLKNVTVLKWDVVSNEKSLPSTSVDYVIHAASETSSMNFVKKPVETICSVVDGTRNVLEFSREAGIKAMVFLSTMEVYGIQNVNSVSEDDYGYLDVMNVRSSYPEAKRLAENLCIAYGTEFGVPVKIARLTQTFGEGVRYDDNRVFAQFSRAIIEGKDIVLNTTGETRRCYCYIGDAVSAIRTIMERGEVLTPYTVANESTFCSIYEMAKLVCDSFSDGKSKVVFDLKSKHGYAPQFSMRLNCERLRNLGWEPKVGLEEMFKRTIGYMANYRKEKT